MELTFSAKPSCLVARVSGELDLFSAARFRSLVDGELQKTGAPNLVINLKGLTFVDSTGLGVILGRHKIVSSWGGRFLLTDVSPKVISMFDMAGLLPLFKIAGTEKEAVELLSYGASQGTEGGRLA